MAKMNPGAGKNIQAPDAVPDGNYSTGNPRAKYQGSVVRGGPAPHAHTVRQLTPKGAKRK